MEGPTGSMYTFIGRAAPPGDRGYRAIPGPFLPEPFSMTDGAAEGSEVAHPALPPAVGGDATYIVTNGLPVADTPTV
jgi:hypothetical protein